jgi:hypothetical protein
MSEQRPITHNDLKQLHAALVTYVNPNNVTGFCVQFYQWVIKTWLNEEYLETETIDCGYDISTQSKATGKTLKETVQTYREFINSANGATEATYISGSGLRANSRKDDLDDLYEDCCTGFIKRWIAEKELGFPDKGAVADDDLEMAADIVELIFTDSFIDEQMGETACEIRYDFGRSGIESEPYRCEVVGLQDGECVYSECKFSDWTLKDFKKTIVVK